MLNVESLQFTLVDCPGHASLIKTIIVGAQIMDITLLVVDATKGIQPQTAECIILGELLSTSTVVALNKTDLFPEDRRMKQTRKAGRAVLEALRLTRFADSELVPVSAKPPGQGIQALRDALVQNLPHFVRRPEAPFLFMGDHCFHVKGHGTVIAGAKPHCWCINGRRLEHKQGGHAVQAPCFKARWPLVTRWKCPWCGRRSK